MAKRSEHAAYLGDGVYVDIDGLNVVLTTENGVEVTNTIYLDRDVLVELTKWCKSMAEKGFHRGTEA